MNTIFMDSKNDKICGPYRIALNPEDRRAEINMLLYQILACTTHGKTYISNIKTMYLKYQVQGGMKNPNYLMDCLQCQIFKIIFSKLSEYIVETVTKNPPIKVYGSKI